MGFTETLDLGPVHIVVHATGDGKNNYAISELSLEVEEATSPGFGALAALGAVVIIAAAAVVLNRRRDD